MSWIQTYSGIKFDLDNPAREMVCIEDIAHSLALQCRFTGHANRFYSVAEHSVLLSHLVSEQYALDALMHDAHEAYCGDLSAPAKRVVRDYAAFESRVAALVRNRFGLTSWVPRQVKKYDGRLGSTEMLALFDDELDYDFNDEPVDIAIVGWDYRVAEVRFMGRFKELQDV